MISGGVYEVELTFFYETPETLLLRPGIDFELKEGRRVIGRGVLTSIGTVDGNT